jgi:hypothetical protein
MEVNLGYLYDILGYMVEAQYWDQLVPEDYLGFIEDYKQMFENQRSNHSREEFRQNLKQVLKAILNNPNLDYDEIFFKGAMHGFGSQDKARKLFELIWSNFFEDEDWHDINFSTSEVIMVDKPFNG